MKVNIYYGGRGLIDDPTVSVINKMTEVLTELRVNIERFNIFELKNTITTLPQTLKEADAIILATTVEWFGIGGYMSQFLDACWLYGDKDKIAGIYMFPVVMSRASGEKEASLSLSNAWELLGGRPCNGLCAYVDDPVLFELNKDYMDIIEKKAEEVYRTVSQKAKLLPSSNNAIRRNMVSDTINLTPQETETLSKYASDDTYIRKQKEDIEELAGMFKDLLEEEDKGGTDRFLKAFKENYICQKNFRCTYCFEIVDKNKSLLLSIDGGNLTCEFGNPTQADVVCKLENAALDKLIEGKKSFQHAFMSGMMTARGDYKNVVMLDKCFAFQTGSSRE